MRKVRTISMSLEPEYVRELDRLAKKAGSRSDALRILLDGARRKREEDEMEEAYKKYYSDPKNVKADRELTKEMLSIAAWPEEDYYTPKELRELKKRFPRRRKPR